MFRHYLLFRCLCLFIVVHDVLNLDKSTPLASLENRSIAKTHVYKKKIYFLRLFMKMNEKITYNTYLFTQSAQH